MDDLERRFAMLQSGEQLEMPEGNMFREELEIFADACRDGKSTQLTAHDGNIAVAMVYAALQSVENNTKLVSVDEVLRNANAKL